MQREDFIQAPSPCCSLAVKFVSLRLDFWLFTAMARALGWAITTTSFLPRVTPVYIKFRSNIM